MDITYLKIISKINKITHNAHYIKKYNYANKKCPQKLLSRSNCSIKKYNKYIKFKKKYHRLIFN